MKHIILAANECGKSDRVVAKLFKVNPAPFVAYTTATMKQRLYFESLYRVDHEKLSKINYSKI